MPNRPVSKTVVNGVEQFLPAGAIRGDSGALSLPTQRVLRHPTPLYEYEYEYVNEGPRCNGMCSS